MQVNQSKSAKTFLKKTNKQKQKQAGAVIFSGINNSQHFFEIWFEVYIVLPCSLLQTSQHQYLLANWSFHFDLKKQSFEITEVASFIFIQFAHLVHKNLTKCQTYMIKVCMLKYAYVKNGLNVSSFSSAFSCSCNCVRLVQNKLGQFHVPFIVTFQIYI